MGKYINVKQLYFLIFILAMYGLIQLFRQNSPVNTGNQAHSATPNLQLPFRNLPLELSEYARCEQTCLGISDSSLPLLMKYGWAETTASPPYLEGNTLSGKKVHAYLTIGSEEVRIDSFDLGGVSCSCQ